MKKYSLELVIFICGAVVMTLELVGSRVLAPFLGTSVYVWTSLIGIILGCLGIGYYVGGRLADKNAQTKTLSLIIFLAGICILALTLSQEFVLSFLRLQCSDVRIAVILAALLLFAPASILLGMVSPYAIRLRIKDVEHSGTLIGNLYALSTFGSIVGTFAAGFFLISHLGTNAVLLTLSGILVLTSLLARIESISAKNIILALVVTGALLTLDFSQAMVPPHTIDKDTAYSRIWIQESKDEKSQRPIRLLSTEYGLAQSGVYLDGKHEMFSNYLPFFQLADLFVPKISKALMIGGAAFTYPREFIERYPEAVVDAVEIDPELFPIAQEYFFFSENPRIRIIYEDGRTFLNRSENQYDVIYLDAFGSGTSIPFQLTTIEAFQRISALLLPEGAVVINIVGSITGKKSLFLSSQIKTIQTVFKNTFLFATQAVDSSESLQNFILIATNTSPLNERNRLTEELATLAKRPVQAKLPVEALVLRDNFAPVEHLNLEVAKEIFRGNHSSL